MPKGFEDVPELSPEEVERRVDVRGGGTPRAPIERPVRRAPPPRRRERTVARDSLLLIGLVVVGLVAVSLLLPDGPLTGAASTPPGTQVAVASATVKPPATGPTATPVGVVATLDVTAGPTEVPTAAPPTPTLAPGGAPGLTPRVTPRVTPVPTARTTPPPGSPTMTVFVNVVNDQGGLAVPSTWRFYPNGASALPVSFLGSSSGTLVTLEPNVPYQISDTAEDPEGAGYAAVLSSHCGSGTGGLLAPGVNVTCTITMYDDPVQVKVVTHVNGPDSASAWNVSVTATGVSPSGTVNGSETGVTFTFDSHVQFDVHESGPSGYDLPGIMGTCSGSGLLPGAQVSCTYTFDATPPPTEPPPTDPPPSPALTLAFLPILLPRRWRPIHRR